MTKTIYVHADLKDFIDQIPEQDYHPNNVIWLLRLHIVDIVTSKDVGKTDHNHSSPHEGWSITLVIFETMAVPGVISPRGQKTGMHTFYLLITEESNHHHIAEQRNVYAHRKCIDCIRGKKLYKNINSQGF
jgi:hypothetical protein